MVRDLGMTTDQRVYLAGLGLLVEVDAIGRQRILLLLGAACLVLLALALRLGILLVGTAHGAVFGGAGALADAVGDEVDGVVAGHLLLLQEIGRMAFALGEDRDHTLAPVTSSRPEDWTWMTARWMTRWKPAVGLESSS